jgi:beta-glucosidase
VLDAVRHDEYAGIALRDATPTGGDAVVATDTGGWIGFSDVDFGSGAMMCRARVCAAHDDQTADVTLRLDDPLQGPVIATFSTTCHGGRYAWVDVTAPVAGATGVRDLYAVLGAAGVSLDALEFSSGV